MHLTGHLFPQVRDKYESSKSEAQKDGGREGLKSLKASNEKFHSPVMDCFSLFVRGQSIVTDLLIVEKLSNSWTHPAVVFWQLIFLLQGTTTVW